MSDETKSAIGWSKRNEIRSDRYIDTWPATNEQIMDALEYLTEKVEALPEAVVRAVLFTPASESKP